MSPEKQNGRLQHENLVYINRNLEREEMMLSVLAFQLNNSVTSSMSSPSESPHLKVSKDIS